MTLLVARMIEERFHRDAEDRPIREGRTPSELLREGDIEYRTCPYSGSRFQHANPMNVSALRQMGAHWDQVCDALAFLRSAHDDALGVSQPQLMDVWRVSQLGSALPWFFLFRDATIPAYAATLAKATLGMGIWAQRTLIKTITERWTPPPLTGESVLELAEANGTLVGETEVCSGSDKMLLKFFDVLVGARAPGRFEAPRDGVLRFGAHYAGFKLYVWIYFLARRFLYADVAATELPNDMAADLEQLREAAVEPSDFFIVEPTNLAAVIPEQRMGWFRSLADLIVPFAPGRADLALRDYAFQLAAVMGQGKSPAETFDALDELYGRVIAQVEAGFRGSGGDIEVPADIRDRLVGASPREFFAKLANAARS
ncbi:MAG TPA: hypothetical protein VIV40_12685 [Kofleriaceae bacterium]